MKVSHRHGARGGLEGVTTCLCVFFVEWFWCVWGCVVNVDGQACAYTKELQRTVTHTQIFLLCRTPVATETEAHPLQTLQDLLHRYCCVDGELVGPSWLAARWSHFLGLLVISLYSN